MYLRFQILITITLIRPAFAVAAPENPVKDCGEQADHMQTIVLENTPMAVLCPGVFVDLNTSRAEQREILDVITEATSDVRSFFGGVHSDRHLVFCNSEICQKALVGKSNRAFVRGPGHGLSGDSDGTYYTAVINVLNERTRGILSHELTHIQMIVLSGGANDIPSWFSEGLATFVANAPLCSDGLPDGVSDLRLVSNPAVMARYTEGPIRNELIYCQARREVQAWAAAVNGASNARILELLKNLRQGASFDESYGSLYTMEDRLPAAGRAFTVEGNVIAILDGNADSRIVMEEVNELSADSDAFSLVAWVRPHQLVGTLVHLSEGVDGNGWCTPLLGFDQSRGLVAQVLNGEKPGPTNYTTVIYQDLKVDEWSHIVATWRKSGLLRLFVNGELVGSASAPVISLPVTHDTQLTWGSPNIAGSSCWSGSVTPGAYAGWLGGFAIEARELDSETIHAIATAGPPNAH